MNERVELVGWGVELMDWGKRTFGLWSRTCGLGEYKIVKGIEEKIKKETSYSRGTGYIKQASIYTHTLNIYSFLLPLIMAKNVLTSVHQIIQ